MGSSTQRLHHRQRSSSFSQAFCLRPQPQTQTIRNTLPRSSDTSTSSSSDGSSSSSYSSIRPARTHRRPLPVVTDEPTSPKIGCMGQIMRGKALTAFPHPSPDTTTKSHHPKLFNFKRILSGKSMTSPCASTGSERRLSSAYIADMDPPLPVVARDVDKDANAGSLWSRRCGGQAVEGLQLELKKRPQSVSISCRRPQAILQIESM